MASKGAGCLSCGSAVMAFVFPLFAFIIGLLLTGGDWKVSSVAALATFMVLAASSLFFASRMQDPSWPVIFVPAIAGGLYALFPDLIPLPFDDAAALTGGALLSLGLAIKKDPSLPRWPIIPILGAGTYVLVGGFIPGPIDELIVFTLFTVPTIVKLQAGRRVDHLPNPQTFQRELPGRQPASPDDGEIIDL